MTIFDSQKTNGARGEGVAPHRSRLVAMLLERSGVTSLSFAHGRPRGPPVAG
jgi:hypothetical protein